MFDFVLHFSHIVLSHRSGNLSPNFGEKKSSNEFGPIGNEFGPNFIKMILIIELNQIMNEK